LPGKKLTARRGARKTKTRKPAQDFRRESSEWSRIKNSNAAKRATSMASKIAYGSKRWTAAERGMANKIALWKKHRIAAKRAIGAANNRTVEPALHCRREGNQQSEWKRIKRSIAAERVAGMAKECACGNERVVANEITTWNPHWNAAERATRSRIGRQAGGLKHIQLRQAEIPTEAEQRSGSMQTQPTPE